jgi:hypothetical protein
MLSATQYQAALAETCNVSTDKMLATVLEWNFELGCALTARYGDAMDRALETLGTSERLRSASAFNYVMGQIVMAYTLANEQI